MDIRDEELLQPKSSPGQTPEKAFHTLIDRHAPAMLRLCSSLVPAHQDAEDILQETFLAAFRAAKSFQQKSSVKTWLYAILFRQVALFRRKRGIPMSQLPDDFPFPTTAQSAVEAHLDLAAALQKIPEQYRTVLILRELDGLSYDEIATMLEIPRGTVESRLHRARVALRNILAPPPAQH